MIDPKTVTDLTFASCFTHPLTYIAHFLIWTCKYFQHFGDRIGDRSLLSPHCWPPWNKFLFKFHLYSLSAFGFYQWWVAKPGLFGTPWARCSWTPGPQSQHWIERGLSGPFQDPNYALYYYIDYEYQKGQKCFLNVKISTFSFVQKILSVTEKLSKVMQLIANPELNPKDPISQFCIF